MFIRLCHIINQDLKILISMIGDCHNDTFIRINLKLIFIKYIKNIISLNKRDILRLKQNYYYSLLQSDKLFV